MSKKMVMTGPGRVVNRTAKRGRIDLAVDPSPAAFLSDAQQQKERIKVLVIPGDRNTDPIEICTRPKSFVLRCEGAQIPPSRLADLEALITEEKDVHVVLEYVPKQDQLPFTGTETSQNREANATPDPTEAAESRGEEIPLKFSGLKGCRVSLSLIHSGGTWYGGYNAQMGHYEGSRAALDGPPTSSLKSECLVELRDRLHDWFDDLVISGTADQKRATTRRRDMMREQMDDQIKKLIDQAELEENDPPKETV